MNMPLFVGGGSSSADRVGAATGHGGIDSQHPEYIYRRPDWCQMRDTWAGQRAVKERGTEYLPATDGMQKDGMEYGAKGFNAYRAYQVRAIFHDFVSDAVDTMIGMMWCKPPRLDMPKNGDLDYMKEKATVDGQGLLQLLRAINRQQLITGRIGLLTDLPSELGAKNRRPYIAPYFAETIINWDAGFRGESPTEQLNLVVLDESGPRRIGAFGWDNVNQYRVLCLGDLEAHEFEGAYRFGVFTQEGPLAVKFDTSQMKEGSVQGTPFDHIPFVFVNANSTVSATCDVPLLGLSNLALGIYRLEADYRQVLFMQGQDTLFTKGFDQSTDNPLRIGAGGHIHARQKEADAKWIGVSGQGLPEMAKALDTNLKMAASKAGELMDASSRARESGTALEMRIGSKTATMYEIAISGAEGLTRALRDAAQWLGMKEKERESILVIPNTEFASKEFASQDFKYLVEAKMLGGAISWQAIHKWSTERGGPGKDITFEEMMEQIEAEQELMEMLAPAPDPAQDEALELKQEEHDMKMEMDQEAHDQKMEMNEESQEQKLRAQKEAAAAKKKAAKSSKPK